MPSRLLRLEAPVFLLTTGWFLGCSASSGVDGPPGLTAPSSGGASVGATGGAASTPTAGGAIGAGGVLFESGGAPGAGGAAAGGANTGGGDPGCNPPADVSARETCDGLDNDLDGFVDESGCPCSTGATQSCFAGPPSKATLPNCHQGTQTCVKAGEFGEWGPCVDSKCDDVVRDEICDNGADDDCDGSVDEGCYLDAEVNLDGDCLSAYCPAQAPNPVGCQITMEGDDSRGCVSHAPGSAEVYFQEGDACPFCIPGVFCAGGAGRVSGTLRCSSDPAPVPLDAANCVINKTEPSYTVPTGTPITQPVSGCAI